MQIYHDASEREPNKRAGDNSRSEESGKLANFNQARFLVIVHETLGITYDQILDSSYPLIEVMMHEYAYLYRKRNKLTENEDTEEDEYVEMMDFETGKLKRVRSGKTI